MANSVDPDQTAPGAVCSGSRLFVSILKFTSYDGQLFVADDFSRRHFQMHFFLDSLRFKTCNMLIEEHFCYIEDVMTL